MPPELTASTPQRRLSYLHNRRLEVFVDIPPSPSLSTKMTPKNTPKPTIKGTPTMSRQTTSNALQSSLKRKHDVFVEIPPSPLHRTTPIDLSKSSSSLHRRRSQVYIEIPASPAGLARLKGTLNNGLKATPLSAKAINMNISAGSPLKKLKLSESQKHTNLEAGTTENEPYPNGYFYCHQCRKKLDNSLGLHCTILYKKRCKAKYCKPCLRNRYGQDAEAIKRRGTSPNARHASGESYQWMCPKCADNCNCFACRKAKGLPPTGFAAPPPLMELGTTTHTSTRDVIGANEPSAHAVTCGDTRATELEQPKPRAPRAKKLIREPRWNLVPTELSRSQIEDRFFLREFILRFSPLMRIGVTYLEELDLFHTLSRQCSKALLQSLLDLIAADAEPEKAKLIRETLKKFSNSGADPAVLWARLKLLRDNLPEDFFVEPIPDPAERPSYAEDESDDGSDQPPQRASSRIRTRRAGNNMSVEEKEVLDLDDGVTHALQLLPCIIALCECALQGPSVHAEIEEGAADARGENRTYFSEIRKENERWANKRALLGWGEAKDEDDEKSVARKGKTKEKDSEKDKAYREALRKHKAKLVSLENAHLLELQGTAPRFGPLGKDSQGRVYYAASAYRRKDKRSKPKIPDEDRKELRKWSWFLAVWGRGGMAGPIPSDQKGEQWWGFTNPAEIRQLAKWLAAVEGVDGKGSVVEGLAGQILKGGIDVKKAESGNGVSTEGPPTEMQVKALVKSLNEYADLFEWRLDGAQV